MSADGEYLASPEAMRAAVGNLGGILVQAIGGLLDLESLSVPAEAYAGLGTEVAAAAERLRGDQTHALRSLLDLLRDTGDAVRHSADAYDDADRTVADGYRSVAVQPFWPASSADALAGQAIADSHGGAGSPYSVGTVLDYLSRAGLRDPAYWPATADVTGFADWLGENADHQARLGLIEVYSGETHGLADVPVVRRGDVVVAGGADAVIGIAGGDGRLYNNGPIGADLTGGGWVRVYRPLPDQPTR